MFVKSGEGLFKFDPEFAIEDLDAGFEVLSDRNKLAVWTLVTSFCEFGEKEAEMVAVGMAAIATAEQEGRDFNDQDTLLTAVKMAAIALS